MPVYCPPPSPLPPRHVVLEVLWTSSDSIRQHELGQPLHPNHELATRVKAGKTLQGQ